MDKKVLERHLVQLFCFLGSLLIAFTSNPVGFALAGFSLLISAAYFLAPQIHKIVGAKAVRRKKLVDKSDWPAFAVLLAALTLYVLTQNALFGLVVFITLLYLLLADIIPKSFDQKTIQGTCIELSYALSKALLVWFAVILLLQTNYPLDVVTSCSMVPSLERGDMIVLQGGSIKAPTVEFNSSVEELLKSASVYKNSCRVSYEGKTGVDSCTGILSIGGKNFTPNTSNDVIVYEPNPRIEDLIIHRVVAVAKNATNSYYFTKGDNNPSLDQESVIAPTPADKVRGKVLFRIPYAGYLKLFLYLQFNAPKACSYKLG
ncbi:hypothetical protein HY993_03775 [Candidatus Micrarchaeota archaeon]|nr:hypothetical protein [Candidatus Micrarchaeota archaeon]